MKNPFPSPQTVGPDDALIERYWLNEATPDEIARVELWFAEHREQRELYGSLHNAISAGKWQPLTASVTAERTIAVLRAIRMDPNTVGNISPLPKRGLSARWSKLNFAVLGAVAALLVFAAGRQLKDAISTQSTGKHVYTYTTGRGERATVRLPDGSTVLLSVASKLEVPSDYTAGNRTIKLDGEALFSVVNNSSQTFTVLSGPSLTRVLGTVFKVRHYRTDPSAIVSVKEGKVSVGNKVVTANERVTVSEAHTSQVTSVQSTEFDFTTGVLTLNDVTLAEALPELGRWYNADIKLADPSVAGLKLVGGFEIGSITDLATLLEMTNNMKVVRDGQTLTIYPRR